MKYTKHNDTIRLQGSIAQMRSRIAIEQGAMHQVQLSVARWRTDVASTQPDEAQVPAMASSLTAWHAAAQLHFLSWLAAGGFAQEHAQASSDSLAAALALPAARDNCPA